MDEKIVDCIYAAIDEANTEPGTKHVLEKRPETPIHGSDSALDSLGLINFVVAVEENVERTFGTPIMLADDDALSREPSPFGSVETLAEYIRERLEGQTA